MKVKKQSGWKGAEENLGAVDSKCTKLQWFLLKADKHKQTSPGRQQWRARGRGNPIRNKGWVDQRGALARLAQ